MTITSLWSRMVIVPEGGVELLSVLTVPNTVIGLPGWTLPGTKSVVSVGAGTTVTVEIPSCLPAPVAVRVKAPEAVGVQEA